MFQKTICKRELMLVSLCIHSNANSLERLNIMKNFLDTENTITYNIKNMGTNTLLCGKQRLTLGATCLTAQTGKMNTDELEILSSRTTGEPKD